MATIEVPAQAGTHRATAASPEKWIPAFARIRDVAVLSMSGKQPLGLRLPPIIGHRGAAGRAPENTLAGFRKAKELGCQWVEFDVRLTGDGGLVLCHDARLDRTTDGCGPVAAKSLADIARLDAGGWFGPEFAGERLPTLDDALSCAAGLGLSVDIEVKAERGREYATGAAVAANLARRPSAALPGLLVSSFMPAALLALRQLAAHVPRGLLLRLVPRGWAELARRVDAAMIGADHRRLRPRQIAAIRDGGYPLAAYTVNNPARARVLFGWGVTSVFTDLPDIILRAGAAPAAVPARQGAFL